MKTVKINNNGEISFGQNKGLLFVLIREKDDRLLEDLSKCVDFVLTK